jgi:hypothetical protein
LKRESTFGSWSQESTSTALPEVTCAVDVDAAAELALMATVSGVWLFQTVVGAPGADDD